MVNGTIEYVVMHTEGDLWADGYAPSVLGRFLWDGSRYFEFIHYEWNEGSEISFIEAAEKIIAYREELFNPIVAGAMISGWAVIPADSEKLKWAKMVHVAPTDNDTRGVGVFRLR